MVRRPVAPVVVALALLPAVAAVSDARARQTPAPAFSRTELQDQDLSIPGRHAVMARSEFQPGATTGRHTHPGEEIGYVLEGQMEITIDGLPPRIVRAGDPIFIPAGAVHTARNTGTVVARAVGTYVLEKGKPLATPVK
jgi:quercetin dioxygenase-like cupin family protein